jgi:hypothetical protein
MPSKLWCIESFCKSGRRFCGSSDVGISLKLFEPSFALVV